MVVKSWDGRQTTVEAEAWNGILQNVVHDRFVVVGVAVQNHLMSLEEVYVVEVEVGHPSWYQNLLWDFYVELQVLSELLTVMEMSLVVVPWTVMFFPVNYFDLLASVDGWVNSLLAEKLALLL